MKTALVHDWLYTFAGAEMVLKHISKSFDQPDLFVMFDFLDAKKYFNVNKTHKSFIQSLPFLKKDHRKFLPLMPLALQRMNVSDYDLVISSSHAVAKGISTRKDQLHICYIHTPMRYAWDMRDQYLDAAGFRGFKRYILKYILNRLKKWDYDNTDSVDYFIANSKFIQKRVKDCYGRNSTVIYPPVDIDSLIICEKKENYYLTASRLVPYKKIDLIVKVFNNLKDKKLIVVGDGPDYERIKNIAGKNVELLGYLKRDKLIDYMRKAKAFVFAAKEDFGILPVEAQACGTPVIAYGEGGALETVLDEKTGLFFYDQTADSLTNAIENFENLQDEFDPKAIRTNAERFSDKIFMNEFNTFINQKYLKFRN